MYRGKKLVCRERILSAHKCVSVWMWFSQQPFLYWGSVERCASPYWKRQANDDESLAALIRPISQNFPPPSANVILPMARSPCQNIFRFLWARLRPLLVATPLFSAVRRKRLSKSVWRRRRTETRKDAVSFPPFSLESGRQRRSFDPTCEGKSLRDRCNSGERTDIRLSLSLSQSNLGTVRNSFRGEVGKEVYRWQRNACNESREAAQAWTDGV